MCGRTCRKNSVPNDVKMTSGALICHVRIDASKLTKTNTTTTNLEFCVERDVDFPISCCNSVGPMQFVACLGSRYRGRTFYTYVAVEYDVIADALISIFAFFIWVFFLGHKDFACHFISQGVHTP